MSYLFLVNIGPVQGFIASARRTGDLAFGSWFLSEISRVAANQIVQEKGILIFPAPLDVALLDSSSNSSDSLNVANKILAFVESEQLPEQLGDQINQAINKRIKEIVEKAYANIPLSEEMHVRAKAQIADLVECTWVALPYVEGTYKGTRLQLEMLMSARKNTRDFQQVTWGDNVPKSSIDGQLESIIPEAEYPSRRASESENLARTRALYKRYKAGSAERLSGVDLLKRQGNAVLGSHFPSTSHIATLPFLKRFEIFMDTSQVKFAWNEYISKLQNLASLPLETVPHNYPSHLILGRYEGSLLFEDRLIDMLYVPTSSSGENRVLQDAKNALRDFYRVLDKQSETLGFSKARPYPYYALLQADGDGMGEVINKVAENGYRSHQYLSQRLATFSKDAKHIVEEYQGVLIYAGGDDVLAFLPLHTLLQCTSKLSWTFQNTLKNFQDKRGRTPTLSVGVAVIHHLEPLRNAREIAHRAERQAKHVDGKNALSIIISKRSGEEYSMVGSWGKNDTDGGIASHLEQLINFSSVGAIPRGTAYELRDMVLHLTASYFDTPTHEEQERLQAVMHCDAQRILQRKLFIPSHKYAEEQIEKVMKFFQLILEQKPQDTKMRYSRSIEEFINQLIVAQVLSDARQLAEPEKE